MRFLCPGLFALCGILAVAACRTTGTTSAALNDQGARSGGEEMFWVDADPGGDPDDIEAFIALARELPEPSRQLVGVGTNLFYPKVKAQITKLVLSELGLGAVPVYAGLGIEPGQEANLGNGIYPGPRVPQAVDYARWPTVFGRHVDQGKSLRQAFGEDVLTRQRIEATPAVDALIDAATRYDGRLVVVVQGPLTNVAAALKKAQARGVDLTSKIKRVVVMGGWMQGVGRDGTPFRRLGYNTVMDVGASITVLNDPAFAALPVVLVNSQAIQDARLFIQRTGEWDVIQLVRRAGGLGKLATALIDDRDAWDVNARSTMSNIVLADPVTALVAVHPELAQTTEPMHLALHDRPGIDMFARNASELFDIEPAGSGRSITLVKGFADPAALRVRMVEHMMRLILPRLPAGRFQEIAQGQGTPQAKAEQLLPFR